MLQLLLIARGIIVLLMGLSIFVKQELKLSGASRLTGRNALLAGAAVVAVGAVTVFYALVILPR